MNNAAIQVQGLGKRYSVRTTASAAAAGKAGRPAGALARFAALLPGRVGGRTTEFWALRDVSFEVGRGEMFGVVGRNGAGKSTMLRLLSRITDPTEGEATLHGRVASLLEVGTGFHQELTGRENVYFSGAIQGMKKSEIDRKFDEIVEFAGVSRFIDMPIKRYSSGMTVRLGFAVAAHLEPEILIVDEVLAVGDAQFQKRCVQKMGEVATWGSTVLLVSHNMDLVKKLTTRCILLEGGRMLDIGPTDRLVDDYLKRVGTVIARDSKPRNLIETVDPVVAVNDFKTLTKGPDRVGHCVMGESLKFSIECEVLRPLAELGMLVEVYTFDGRPVYGLVNADGRLTLPTSPGAFHVELTLPSVKLYPGLYNVRVTFWDESGIAPIAAYDPIETFEVLLDPSAGPLHRFGQRVGIVHEHAEWRLGAS